MKNLTTAAVLAVVMATGSVAFGQTSSEPRQDPTAPAAPSGQQTPSTPGSGVQPDRDANRQANGERRGILGIGGSDAKDIRATIQQLTDNALDDDGWDNLRMRLVDADRNRISKFDLTDAKEDALEAKIEMFHKAWKARYNEDFRPRRNDEYLVEAQVQEGEIGRDAQLASEVIRNSETSKKAGGPGTDAAGNSEADQNLEDGRNIAVVTLPGAGGNDAIRVPMIHEFPDSWKVNVPDRVTGEVLYNNLDQCLTKLLDKQSEWPTDKNQAYRLVTYKIACAVLDVDHDPAKKLQGDMERGMDAPRSDQPGTPGSVVPRPESPR